MLGENKLFYISLSEKKKLMGKAFFFWNTEIQNWNNIQNRYPSLSNIYSMWYSFTIILYTMPYHIECIEPNSVGKNIVAER